MSDRKRKEKTRDREGETVERGRNERKVRRNRQVEREERMDEADR